MLGQFLGQLRGVRSVSRLNPSSRGDFSLDVDDQVRLVELLLEDLTCIFIEQVRQAEELDNSVDPRIARSRQETHTAPRSG